METPSYVAEDARLENASEATSEALAKHRWHWTLDETNPDRVSINRYAKDVARNRATISTYVKAYAFRVEGADQVDTPFSALLEKAKLGNDLHAAAEAVAKTKGVSVGTVRLSNMDEAKAVRDEARDRAERKGTSVEEEATHVAEQRQMARTSRQKQAERRRQRHSLRFIQIDGAVAKAKRELKAALAEATDVPFDDEERELMASTIEQLEAVIALLKLELTGTSDIDWDAELAKLV